MRLMMLVAGAASALLTTATVAQERPSVANSFPLGNGGDTACTVPLFDEYLKRAMPFEKG